MKFSLQGLLPGHKPAEDQRGAKGKAKKGAKGGAGSGAGSNRRDVLGLKPIRNPAIGWEELEGQVILTIKREKTQATGWKTKLAGIFINVPDHRTVELDAIGTDVWLMLDGENSIDAIVKALIKKHKLSRRETELSLQEYFKNLSRRGYIAFVTDKPNAEKPNADKPGSGASNAEKAAASG